ncbi:MAG: GGDEF domain-containing protein, partial [Bacteroidota bacterium]
LRRENNRLNYDMIVLYQFATNLANCRSTDAVCQEFITTVQQSIEAEVGGLFLQNPDGSFRLAAHRGLEALEDPVRLAPFDRGFLAWVVEKGCEVVVDETGRDPRFPELREWPFADLFRAAIALPLLVKQQALGVVVVGRSAGGFTQDELRLLFIITNEAALYLQNLRLYEEVASLAVTDGPTGLYNHRYFFEEIDRQLRLAKERGSPLTLLMIDIDNFKPLNDRYGHLTGDAILRAVALILQAKVGPRGQVARYGGEEFAVLLPGAGPEEARQVAEEIRENVRRHQFTTLDGRTASVTVSIGLATYPDHLPDAATTVIDLIAASDEQLVVYAKRGGKNRVCLPR